MSSHLRTSLAVVAALVVAGCATPPPPRGPGPVVDIDPARHGNLAAAQELILRAFERMSDAQDANDYRLGGHAGHAKDLLREASEQLRLAADAANRR